MVKRNFLPSFVRWYPLLVLVLFGNLAPVIGQGFMVKPLMIETKPRPGETLEIPLELRNTATDGPRTIDLQVVKLMQSPTGKWRAKELSNGHKNDPSNMASAHEWITLGQEKVPIAPLQPVKIMVRIETPPEAQGAYSAALVAEPPLSNEGQPLVVRTRFLIPVIIEIQGRTVRQQVKMTDLGLNNRPDEGRRPATTLTTMHIANNGHTFSRVGGELRVEFQQSGRWRPVVRAEFRERSIIPGASFILPHGLGRRLPSGTYRLRGELYVDGRRVEPMEKVIEFEGDPDVDTLAFDRALELEPGEIELNVSPGATRTTSISVNNPSEDHLKVRADAVMPESLSGVAMGELQGDELSAAGWVQVRPAEFTLRPEGRQNLRVMSRIPREGVGHARYYAELVLNAVYEDGQSAGETTSMLTVVNSEIEAAPEVICEHLSIANEGGAKYIVQGRIANVGNVHIVPGAEAEVLGERGSTVVSTRLDGESSVMLPLATRRFAGTVDFENVKPGSYILRAHFSDDGRRLANKQILLEVDEGKDGEKNVRITGDEADAEQD